MNGLAPDLRQLQQWMQSVITHPHGIVAGIASDEAAREITVDAAAIEQVVRPSRQLTSIQRLAVYGNAYYARLLECLRADYPVLREIVGVDTFDVFAAGYLQAHPSTSYTLTDLGGRFADYLRDTRPERGASDIPDWADFVVDLATLERITSEVFDGPGDERDAPLRPQELLSIPAERRSDVRVRLSRSLRLVTFRFPVQLSFPHGDRRGATEIPVAAPTWLAVHRRDWVVRHTPLTADQFRLLERLQSGGPLVAVLAAALEESPGSSAEIERSVERWFHDWTVEGLLRTVE
jgi:hypothetical protein